MPKTILIVDDEADIAEVLKRRLEANGYQVGLAENGLAALSMVRARKIDLIILDIMMPMMSGPELADSLKNDPQTAKIPIIFLSAILERQESFGDDPSPNVIFAKPFDADELVAKIKQMVGD